MAMTTVTTPNGLSNVFATTTPFTPLHEVMGKSVRTQKSGNNKSTEATQPQIIDDVTSERMDMMEASQRLSKPACGSASLSVKPTRSLRNAAQKNRKLG